jgi:hypothetical protein
MGSAVLVEGKIEAGRTLLEALDRIGFPIRSAFWFYFPDDEAWRLVIASSLVREQGTIEGYRRMRSAFPAGEELPLDVEEVWFVKDTEHLVEILKQAVTTGPAATKAIRLSRSGVGGIYIDDALIYRST